VGLLSSLSRSLTKKGNLAPIQRGVCGYHRSSVRGPFHVHLSKPLRASIGDHMTKGIQQSNHCFRACLAVAGMLLLFTAGLSGQTVARVVSTLMNRPPNVPEEYVITPFGYFHPSCVQMLTEGNTLLADGRVEHPDGNIDVAPVCYYPHYTSTGLMVPVGAEELRETGPLVINGWLESVSATTSTSYGKVTASWIVPPAPTSEDGQTLFFFPGFEDTNNVISIVQPVLQFGPSTAGGGNFWAVASWNCCISGTTWYSPLLDVSSGDTILGAITQTCKPGGNYCPTWNVVSMDKTTGKKTTLAKTAADGQIWNWAFGAVSEDYGVIQCGDFPANSGLTFTVHLYDQNGNVIANPGWQGTQWIQNPNPTCNYGTKITTTKETVEY